MIVMFNRKDKITRFLMHILLWFLFLGISFFFEFKEARGITHIFTELITTELPWFIILFYINYFKLVPDYLFKKRFIRYSGINISFIVISCALTQIMIAAFPHPHDIHDVWMLENHSRLFYHIEEAWEGFGLGIMVIGMSTAIKFIQKWSADERKQQEMEKEQVKTELALLKNRISPHFFFNTLNNIYSLIEFDSDSARDAVHKLSKLMRYILYESDVKLISLEKEKEFLENYTKLMRIRISEEVRVQFNTDIEDNNILIPPLLFVSFVENAFKHGISYENSSYIDMSLTQKSNNVEFSIINSVCNKSKATDDLGGIGLSNIKKRLELLFNDDYELIITSESKSYNVVLKLDLSKLTNND